MSWSAYATFVTIAAAVVVMPGPDFAVVTANTISGGRRRGIWCAAGVASSNAIQGIAAVAGLGALIVSSQPVFDAIRWLGAMYLIYLGIRLLRSAVRGRYPAVLETGGHGASRGWRQGFLSNITNPKVLVFYLAVLPQFLTPGSGAPALLAFALSHALLSLTYLAVVTVFLHRARGFLTRLRVRRSLDGITGVALVGFGARVALDRS